MKTRVSFTFTLRQTLSRASSNRKPPSPDARHLTSRCSGDRSRNSSGRTAFAPSSAALDPGRIALAPSPAALNPTLLSSVGEGSIAPAPATVLLASTWPPAPALAMPGPATAQTEEAIDASMSRGHGCYEQSTHESSSSALEASTADGMVTSPEGTAFESALSDLHSEGESEMIAEDEIETNVEERDTNMPEPRSEGEYERGDGMLAAHPEPPAVDANPTRLAGVNLEVTAPAIEESAPLLPEELSRPPSSLDSKERSPLGRRRSISLPDHLAPTWVIPKNDGNWDSEVQSTLERRRRQVEATEQRSTRVAASPRPPPPSPLPAGSAAGLYSSYGIPSYGALDPSSTALKRTIWSPSPPPEEVMTELRDRMSGSNSTARRDGPLPTKVPPARWSAPERAAPSQTSERKDQAIVVGAVAEIAAEPVTAEPVAAEPVAAEEPDGVAAVEGDPDSAAEPPEPPPRTRSYGTSPSPPEPPPRRSVSPKGGGDAVTAPVQTGTGPASLATVQEGAADGRRPHGVSGDLRPQVGAHMGKSPDATAEHLARGGAVHDAKKGRTRYGEQLPSDVSETPRVSCARRRMRQRLCAARMARCAATVLTRSCRGRRGTRLT